MGSAVFPEAQQRSGAIGQQLLPGIVNEITLDKIAPKLSWRDLYTLSLVSPAWRQANQSRQVYNARVRSHSTETLAILNYSPHKDIVALALFSPKNLGGEDSWELPPIPGFQRGIPRWCGCVCLDGKVYILGGGLDSICENGEGKVFVLDLAGQKGWKRCESMKEARQGFGCCVKDGKIYGFGGMFGTMAVSSSEVYDPNEDKWSLITPMPSLRVLHTAEFMGDEIVLHGGRFLDPLQQLKFDPDTLFRDLADVLEFYNPVKDEWRSVGAKGKEYSFELIFICDEKVHVLDGCSFSVYHGEGHQWLSGNTSLSLAESCGGIRKTLLSYAGTGEPVRQCWCFHPSAALRLHDELLVILTLEMTDGDLQTCLVLGKGFRTSTGDIQMEIAFEFEGHCETNHFIVPVEL